MTDHLHSKYCVKAKRILNIYIHIYIYELKTNKGYQTTMNSWPLAVHQLRSAVCDFRFFFTKVDIHTPILNRQIRTDVTQKQRSTYTMGFLLLCRWFCMIDKKILSSGIYWLELWSQFRVTITRYRQLMWFISALVCQSMGDHWSWSMTIILPSVTSIVYGFRPIIT